uniref:Cyclase family protein n=1 Tax=Oryza glumipatula TaxID=40148 RepID=A0A0D9YNF8_9ORYZ
MAASRLPLLLLLAVAAGRHALPAAGSDAHPGYDDGAEDTCGVPAAAAAAAGRMEEYGGGRILDITHAYRADLPEFAPGAVTGPVVRLKDSMANGSICNLSELKMHCHTGTHVDAPGHINQGHFAAGLDVDKLDLDLLNGTPSPPPPLYLFPYLLLAGDMC